MTDDGTWISTEETIAKIGTKPPLRNALIEAGSTALMRNGKKCAFNRWLLCTLPGRHTS
jgi:hypothetical protein